MFNSESDSPEIDSLEDRLYQKLNFHDEWTPLRATKTTESQLETQAKLGIINHHESS